jgi:enterochelin esterase family protein
VTERLLPLVYEHGIVAHGRENLAFVGLSMGGGQALSVGLHNLDRIAWIGMFNSAFPEGDCDAMSSGRARDPDRTNSLLRLLWIGCGDEDFLRDRNSRFESRLQYAGTEHTYRLSSNGHVWRLWREYPGIALPLLFRGNAD